MIKSLNYFIELFSDQTNIEIIKILHKSRITENKNIKKGVILFQKLNIDISIKKFDPFFEESKIIDSFLYEIILLEKEIRNNFNNNNKSFLEDKKLFFELNNSYFELKNKLMEIEKIEELEELEKMELGESKSEINLEKNEKKEKEKREKEKKELLDKLYSREKLLFMLGQKYSNKNLINKSDDNLKKIYNTYNKIFNLQFDNKFNKMADQKLSYMHDSLKNY